MSHTFKIEVQDIFKRVFAVIYLHVMCTVAAPLMAAASNQKTFSGQLAAANI